MGGALSSWFPRLFGGREVRVLILGLDNAGKTTILCRLFSLLQLVSPLGRAVLDACCRNELCFFHEIPRLLVLSCAQKMCDA